MIKYTFLLFTYVVLIICQCPTDTLDCPDGITKVGRDPAKNCDFKPCPVVCPADTKFCSGSYYVGRDPAKNCEFKPCPPTTPAPTCTQDAKNCSDGTVVGRDPARNCDFIPCPPPPTTTPTEGPTGSPSVCTKELKWCSDGTSRTRDPNNNCEFKPCPTSNCPADTKNCPDGSTVGKDPERNCLFKLCPNEVNVAKITGEVKGNLSVSKIVDACKRVLADILKIDATLITVSVTTSGTSFTAEVKVAVVDVSSDTFKSGVQSSPKPIEDRLIADGVGVDAGSVHASTISFAGKMLISIILLSIVLLF